MASIRLDSQEKKIFAEAAHALRFEDSPMGDIVKPEKLLSPRRQEEINANDLFSVFNIVQENTIKGGIVVRTRDARGHTKRVTTREVKSIDQNIKLNKALWTLSEKMMKLKGL